MRRGIALIPLLLFWAAGAEPGNDFRFAIVGDRTGAAQPGVYERIWADMGPRRPDFAINVGDTIEGGADELARQQWRALRPLWSRYAFPVYFTPGNHDIWSPRSLEIYKSETGRSNFYSFNYRNAHFTVLDNGRTLDLADDQLAFLENDLQANRERSPKFVFFHVPYWIAFLKLGSGEFPLHKLARKYGVNYIVSGHGHQFVRMTRDGITYLEVGSSGALLKGEGFEKGWFYHYLWAVVKDGHAELSAQELDGKRRAFRVEDWNRQGAGTGGRPPQ